MFQNKVVIITGAGRGIGKAAAISFAKKGAKVALAARTESQLQETAAEIAAAGGKCLVVPTDVADGPSVRNMLDRTVRELGGLDVVVNNAAIDQPKLILDTTDEEWDRVLAINLKSVFMISRDAAKIMIANKTKGRIVNISTINVRRSEPYYAAYGASKGGLEAFTLTSAAEFGPYGITVNAVAPGSVMTIMNKDAYDPAKVAWKEKRIPMGKIGQPEDIVPPIEFFASDEAWYLTGQILMVDGGSFINANREITWGGEK